MVEAFDAALAMLALSERSVASSAWNSSYECDLIGCSPCSSATRIVPLAVACSTLGLG